MLLFDLLKKTPEAAFGTLYVRCFGLLKIPLLWFVRPQVVEVNDARVEIKIPLLRRNRNQLGSMYFGVLTTGADLCAAYLAMRAIVASKEPISLIFKNMQADFLKRAEGDVHFTCEEGVLITDLVEKAVETGARVELPVPVVATVPSKLGQEPIARFTLLLSLKKQEKQHDKKQEKKRSKKQDKTTAGRSSATKQTVTA